MEFGAYNRQMQATGTAIIDMELPEMISSYILSSMKITILGSGTSHGVPMIGCDCEVCTSQDEKNRRSRASVWIEKDDVSILIDTSTDFRFQALREGIHDIDAILYTHAHADHVHGLDDIRPYSYKHIIPVFGNNPTIRELRRRFEYIFRNTQRGGGKPRIGLNRVGSPFSAGSVEIIPIPIMHGKLQILGFRIGDFSYLTDCSDIPESSYPLLEGTRLLVIGALRYKEHETHYSVDQAVEQAERIGAEKTYLTHLCHRLEHNKLLEELPGNVRPAWDGLTLFLENGLD